MRRVAAAIGLVIALAAAGFTQLPFSREAPRATAVASGSGQVGFGHPVETRCASSWQGGQGWCASTGRDRRTAAAAVGGTALLWALVMVIVLPRRRILPEPEPSFCFAAAHA